MAVEFLVDFLVFTAIGLGGDWFAFSSLKNMAGAFWPVNVAYRDTPMPRLALAPIGACLGAYAPGPALNAFNLTGLVLVVAPIGIQIVWFIRQFLKARPRD